VNISGTHNYQYRYDGSGNRLEAIRDGNSTRDVNSASGNLLAEANGSNVIQAYYIYGAGLLAMVTPGGQFYCYHFDGTGNTVAMTDINKAVVNEYAYTPFGIIGHQQEAFPQPFKYVGQHGVMAEPNGFYYMRARYYDPNLGRFVSEDPIGFEGGDVNLYLYVRNNPVNLIDPRSKLAFYWHFGITFAAALNSGYGLSDSWSLANNVMAEDRSALSHNPNDTVIHAMDGQLPGGGYQASAGAIATATTYINNLDQWQKLCKHCINHLK
jgi:RHS repeat-associated protein